MEGALAYLKGSLADGHVYDLNKRIRIVVRQKNKEWLENTIAPILKDVSGKNPKILRTPDGIYIIYVYIHKNNLDSDVLNILMKPLNEVKFDTLSDEISFLRGFFDAEGSIYKNKNKKSDIRVIMYQKDKKILEYTQYILQRLEIRAKIYGPYKNGTNNIFRLIVFTWRNVEKFLKHVGTSNKVKFNLL
ncbi:MAG: LAGLIDADG family homing endonuclease [Candidatus Aenigmatarchaeota archaeon]